MGLPTFTRGRGRDLVYLPGLSLTHDVPRRIPRRVESALLGPLARDHAVHWLGRRRDVPAGFAIADFARDAAEHLRDRFSGPVPVVGFSTGGFVGLRLAMDHPEVVDRLVVVAAVSQLSARARRSEERWIELLQQGRSAAAWWELAADVAQPGPASRALARLVGRVGPRATPASLRDGVATARADIAFDVAGQLGTIRVPTLLVVGLRDSACDIATATRTRAAIPHAQLLLLPRTGHLGSLVHPRAIRRVRDFLAGDLG